MAFTVIGSPNSDRDARVGELRRLGFTWADLGEEHYWVDQAVALEAPVYRELFDASGKLWEIYDRAARFVIGRRDVYEALSIPEVLWDGLDRITPNPPGLISRYARFDFCVNEAGRIKLLELNADTPTGYVEAAAATPWMCEALGLMTPNTAMPELVREAWAAERPEYATCIAYGQHLEDTGTIDMLVRHSGLQAHCLDTLELWVDDGVLKDGKGRPVRSLFALYPKEWMGIDDGGEALAYCIESGSLRIMNPLHAVILQSKGLQALIWGLHELGAPLFTPEQHDTIEDYMLPTYDTPVFEGNYVSKSMFGREGGSVRMYDGSGNMDVQDESAFDTSEFFKVVYQERAELPPVSLHCGELRLLTGVFVINGRPCGLLGRAGGLITGNASHFVAIGVKKD